MIPSLTPIQIIALKKEDTFYFLEHLSSTVSCKDLYNFLGSVYGDFLPFTPDRIYS